VKCRKHVCVEEKCIEKCRHKPVQIGHADNKDIEKIKYKKKLLIKNKELLEYSIKLLDTVIETYEKHPTNYYNTLNIKNVANNIKDSDNNLNAKIIAKLNNIQQRILNYVNVKLSEKKINLQEFKLTNKSNSSNKICTELLFKVSKQKITSNSKRENNILYNNMINNDISKANLKNDPFIKKNIQLSKINIKQILHHYLCCIKNNNIIKIENIRKKILSEEKFFSSYFIITVMALILMIMDIII
jgi:hypothetical protein